MNKMYKNILLLFCMLGASRNIAGSEMSRFFKHFDGPPCFIGLLTGVVACIVHKAYADVSRWNKESKLKRSLQASREAKKALATMAADAHLLCDKVTYRKDTIDKVIAVQEIELGNITAELSAPQAPSRLMRNAIIMPFSGMLGGGIAGALEVSSNEAAYTIPYKDGYYTPPFALCAAGALAAIVVVQASITAYEWIQRKIYS